MAPLTDPSKLSPSNDVWPLASLLTSVETVDKSVAAWVSRTLVLISPAEDPPTLLTVALTTPGPVADTSPFNPSIAIAAPGLATACQLDVVVSKI